MVNLVPCPQPRHLASYSSIRQTAPTHPVSTYVSVPLIVSGGIVDHDARQQNLAPG